MTTDERRTARLLFSAERAAGDGPSDEDLDRPEVLDAVRAYPVPSRLSRALQRVQMRRGGLTYLDFTVERALAARAAVLGPGAAAGPPRLLVRVDEFPHYQAFDPTGRYGTAAYARFHAIMAEAGMPYLIAVPARVSRDPLNPKGAEDRPLDDGEVEMLADLRHDGVAFALHGLDHRTRHRSPRRRSELTGLRRKALDQRLERAEAELAERAALRPDVFVPPYNRFAWHQWDTLAERFSAVGGGPESVATFGFHTTPSWRGDAVWLPSYPPLYGRAGEVGPAARALAERQAALWVPVVLHWGWELDDGWSALERFAREAAPYTASWDDFLAAVRASR